MHVGKLWRLAVPVAAVAATLALAPAVSAAEAPTIVVEGGVTQPVFGYEDAIRERVWVTIDYDTDQDGVLDEVAVDIIRPAAGAEGLKSPVIMDASPYYTTLCRGNDSECIADFDGDGINDKWPLFYDNYFVPRGYAVMLLHMVGTGFSNGCPLTGPPAEHMSAVAAIDWLNGRRPARDAEGNLVTADWHNGKTGMIGKSYDGTLANGAASTGVDGLATIVPISAISSWYLYTRQAGLGLSGWASNYPASLSNTVTNPSRRAYCSPIRSMLNATDGDENYDFTPFWQDRDYLKDLDKVKASVFLVHGLEDDNVKMNHAGEWWDGLTERDVPRKAWFTRVGHTEPFDSRRDVWVDTIHRWFDYWLQGYPNGIMGEPMVTVERESGDVYEEYADWPVPDAVDKTVYLRATESGPGMLSLSQGATAPTTSFVDQTNQSENTIINNPMTVTNTKRVFLSEPLTAPLKFTGTPVIRLRASVNRVGTSLGAALVDYGPITRVSRSTGGILTSSEEDCWGESSANDDACYRITTKRLQDATQWRVTRGIHDARNRTDLTAPTDLVTDQFYDFEWKLMPEDHVFEVGHRIGVILVMSYGGVSAANTNYGATLTVDLQNTSIELPLSGGYQAAVAAGIPGVEEQLADLKVALQGVGPGTSSADKIAEAEAYLAAGDFEGVCGMLLHGFPYQLQANLGKKLTAEQAAAFTAEAAEIAAVLEC